MKTSYYTKVVGVTFEDRQDVIARMTPKTKLRLRREPDNVHDENAVAVDALVGKDWSGIGYIAKGKNLELANHMENDVKVSVELSEVTGGGDKSYGVNIGISYSIDELPELVKLTPDIGEGYVMFDSKNHVYYDEEGNRMISGSVFEENHSPDVNFTYAARAMSKTTGVKPNAILELWDGNKNLSASYGTVLHESLEYYFKNHHLMKQIDEVRERAHTATNYMPTDAGKIVDEFIARFDTEFASRCSPELFIRHGNRCGFVDLIEENGDTMVMHDYKFIKQLKKVKYKEYGLHNKYTLQQNFYREIIEDNGYKVKAMNLQTYIGGAWGEVQVERLNLEG